MKIDHAVDPGLLDPRAASAAAEAAGFDGIWMSEIKHDPFVSVTLAAAATERITLCTGIAVI